MRTTKFVNKFVGANKTERAVPPVLLPSYMSSQDANVPSTIKAISYWIYYWKYTVAVSAIALKSVNLSRHNDDNSRKHLQCPFVRIHWRHNRYKALDVHYSRVVTRLSSWSPDGAVCDNQLGAAENLTGWYPALAGVAVLDSDAEADDDDDDGLFRSFSDEVIAAAKPKQSVKVQAVAIHTRRKLQFLRSK